MTAPDSTAWLQGGQHVTDSSGAPAFHPLRPTSAYFDRIETWGGEWGRRVLYSARRDFVYDLVYSSAN